MSFVDIATGYADAVINGERSACRFVRLAAERYLADLESDEYYLDAEELGKVVRFVQLLPHTKDIWRGRPLELEPWQIFIIANAFGVKRTADDRRKYRRVYIEVPRKNGKSLFSAALGLYALCFDGVAAAEVYCGAGTEQQAWEVFRPAKSMVEQTAQLRNHIGLKVNAKTLVVPGNGSRFAPVIGKPGDGASPSFAIVDEYHEHATEEQHDTFLTGMGARQNPLLWVITTAGADTQGPCYALRHESIEVLEGKVQNPSLFAIIYTLDDGDDWSTEAALEKANPNYGVSVDRQFLLDQQRDARNNPRKQSAFLTKHLNVWVGSASPFLNMDKWDRLGDTELRLDDFKGTEGYLGVDLAAKIDITASGILFRRVIDGDDHYYWFPRFYVPEPACHKPENRAYDGWVRAGYMTATPNANTDFQTVTDDLVELCEGHNVIHAAFDQWNSMHMSQTLAERTGVTCVDIPMTTKHLSDPLKWLQALIEDGRMHHDGNPVMSWMIGNVTAKPDRNDNVYPRKERPEDKIDGVIALLMALERGFQLPEARSYLEAHELLVL